MKETSLGIIGCGNMGSAIIRALLKKKIFKKSDIFGLEHDPKRIKALGIQHSPSIPSLVSHLSSVSSLLILAVKPQQFSDIAKELKGKIPHRTTVISIMAGITIKKLTKELGHKKIVRAMPNTPAIVGEGMTVWYATPQVLWKNKSYISPSPATCPPKPTGKGREERDTYLIDRERSEGLSKLFSSFGLQLQVKSEKMIDSATAVSGSGPAYVFVLAEAWIDGAKKNGFNETEATLLIQQTMKGALKLWTESTETPKTLREKVTSKGGTTEAALNHLNSKEWEPTFTEAIEKAYRRAKELGKQL